MIGRCLSRTRVGGCGGCLFVGPQGFTFWCILVRNNVIQILLVYKETPQVPLTTRRETVKKATRTFVPSHTLTLDIKSK